MRTEDRCEFPSSGGVSWLILRSHVTNSLGRSRQITALFGHHHLSTKQHLSIVFAFETRRFRVRMTCAVCPLRANRSHPPHGNRITLSVRLPCLDRSQPRNPRARASVLPLLLTRGKGPGRHNTVGRTAVPMREGYGPTSTGHAVRCL